MTYFQHVEECKKLGDKSKCCRTNLAKMLPHALDRMSSSGTEAFQQPVTTDVAPNYFDFVNYPMDMGTLRQVCVTCIYLGPCALNKKVPLRASSPLELE